jgi:membrane protease YdiL (CAAX protease family)
MPPVPATPPGPLPLLTGAMLTSAVLGAWIWAIHCIATGRPLLPRKRGVPVPWRGPTVLLMFLLWFAIQVGAAWAYLEATGGVQKKKDLSPAGLMTMLSLANAATLAALPQVLRRLAGARPEHFGLGPGAEPATDLARGAVAGLILAPVVYAVGFVAVQVWPPRHHPLEEMIRADPSGRIALLALLSAVVLAPAAEELLFRGILQGWLVRLWGHRPAPPAPPPGIVVDDPALADLFVLAAVAPPPDPDRSIPRTAPPTPPVLPRPRGTTPAWAVLWPGLLTSFVFAAIHASEWPSPIPIFVLSLGLGFVYERTGGLLAPFALHATFNGISTLMLFISLLSGGDPTL